MTLYLTELGKSLILQTLCSPDDAEIYFNGVVVGNGDQSEQGAAVTTLGNQLNEMTITNMTTDDDFVNITAFLSNSYVLAGYHVTELGVMVRDPNDHDEQILFAYSHVNEDEAMYLPAAGDYSLETTFTLKVYVGDVQDVSAAINSSLVYATKAAFDEHVSDTENPHNVTAAQVGLGAVENVSTNDQTPTYTEAESTSVLVSGEKLSAAFSKIAAAVRAVINHISNRDNPHGVTYSQTGAAASSHKHSATDITSGTLAVARGGTGVTSLATLLTSLIEGRNVVLSNARYLYGRDTAGNNRILAGINGSNETIFGADPNDNTTGKATHLHSGGSICIRSHSGTVLDSGETNSLNDSTNKLHWYLNMSMAGNVYPDSNGGNHRTGKQHLGTFAHQWNNVYCVATNISSDRKKKNVLGDISCAKRLILGLDPVEFFMINDEKHRRRWGFIAQDVYALAKNIGIENAGLYSAGYLTKNYDESGENDEYHDDISDEEIDAKDDADLDWGLDYVQLIAPMVKVIQEQELRIAALENMLREET